LLYANSVIRTSSLIVPHERLTQRRFVLVPLLELKPDLRDPVTRRPLREHLGSVASQELRKVDFRPVLPA
jgi:2-amino-4-hydroxy-6-hydroxymethyldihydropteridine diphosphokinase